jgi:hypothetical protein
LGDWPEVGRAAFTEDDAWPHIGAAEVFRISVTVFDGHQDGVQ